MKINLLLTIMLVAGFANAQVLPSSRSVNWKLAGLRQSVPNYSTVVDITNPAFRGLGNGSYPNDTALTRAVASLSGGNGVIYFPPGIYLFKSTITLRSGIILRGASAEQSVLQLDLPTPVYKNFIDIVGSTTTTTATLTSNVSKDSAAVFVGSAAGFAVGDYIRFSFNDSSLIYSADTWAYGTVGQIARIAGIAGNKIILNSPLRMGYDVSKNPKITKLNMISGVGIENIKLQCLRSSTYQTKLINFDHAAGCWVSCIEGYNCNFANVSIITSTNLSITGSYFHDAFAYGGSGQGYGVACQYTSGECLIENNIFKHLRHGVMFQAGANGNVSGYNYAIENYWTEPGLPPDGSGDMVLHGNWPYANLFEGNIGQNITIDNAHGKNGPFNTFLRNRAELYGIFMSPDSVYPSNQENFIGNEVTADTMGYYGPYYGLYYLYGTDHFEYGNNVRGVIHAPGTSALSDTSYYYSTMPSFLASSSWPSIGIPNTINSGSNPAKTRFISSTYTACSSTPITSGIGNNTITGDQSVCANVEPAILVGSTPTGGDSTYTYIWQKSTTSATSGFTAVTGIYNSINYTPPVLTVSTWFRRIVTSGGNKDTSGVIRITVNASTTSSDTQTACDSYVWNGTTYTTSGDKFFHTINASGCDSTMTLHLRINHGTTSDTSQTACDSYVWNGTTYTTSGDKIFHTTNASGCDSTMTLHLRINHGTTSDTSQTACDSYVWNGTTYTTSGDKIFHTTNTSGCDSTMTLHLRINSSYRSSYNVSICSGSAYMMPDGTTIRSDSTHINHLITSTGCDSIIVVNLTVNNLITHTIDANICAGDSIFAGSLYQTLPGSYYDSLHATGGCDSILVTHLLVNTLPIVSLRASQDITCDTGTPIVLTGTPAGGTYSGMGVSDDAFYPQTGAGTYTVRYNYTDGNGCSANDSTSISVDICTEITAIASTAASDIFVYPNPSSGVFYLSSENFTKAKLILRDVRGRCVMVKAAAVISKSAAFEIDLSNMENAVYFLEVITNNKTEQFKMIKQ